MICGGPSERGLAESLLKQCNAPLLNLAGKTTLGQMGAVLGRARLLIANDTSAVHSAAAMGTPSICLVGGGHFGRFLPYEVEKATDRPLPIMANVPMPCYGCNWRCIFNRAPEDPVPCVEKISVELVWEAIRTVPGLSVAGDGTETLSSPGPQQSPLSLNGL